MTNSAIKQEIPKMKDCGHRWDCGCYKELCKNCNELLENGDWDLCDNEGCVEYYKFRNDNCDCEKNDCIYCKTRREQEITNIDTVD